MSGDTQQKGIWVQKKDYTTNTYNRVFFFFLFFQFSPRGPGRSKKTHKNSGVSFLVKAELGDPLLPCFQMI